MKKATIVFLVIIIAALSILIYRSFQKKGPVINNFAGCFAAGYSLQGLSPQQCTTPNGHIFTQNIGNTLAKQDLIVIDSPKADTLITSPLEVRGSARGNWFFEASFPVKIYDSNNMELGSVPAQAQGEWMTTQFVPFSVIINFSAPTTATGTLILKKDNPSGLPQNDDSLIIPLHFSI
jgi:hypothetical protein